MKKILVLVLVLFVAVLMVAAIKPAQLTVKNRSDVDLVLYLFPVGEQGVSGLSSFSATVPFHSERVYSLAPGAYHFEVYGCEKVITGTVDVRGHFTLLLPACERLLHVPQQLDGALKFIPE